MALTNGQRKKSRLTCGGLRPNTAMHQFEEIGKGLQAHLIGYRAQAHYYARKKRLFARDQSEAAQWDHPIAKVGQGSSQRSKMQELRLWKDRGGGRWRLLRKRDDFRGAISRVAQFLCLPSKQLMTRSIMDGMLSFASKPSRQRRLTS